MCQQVKGNLVTGLEDVYRHSCRRIRVQEASFQLPQTRRRRAEYRTVHLVSRPRRSVIVVRHL